MSSDEDILPSAMTGGVERITKADLERSAKAEKARIVEESQKREQKRQRESIVKRAMDSTLSEFNPSVTQERFAEMYILNAAGDNTWKSLAKRCGVSEKTVYNWFNDSGFRAWLMEVRAMYFAFYRPMVDQKLIELALKGSYKHQELFYTLAGDIGRTIESKKDDTNFDSLAVEERFRLFHERIVKLSGRAQAKDSESARMYEKTEEAVIVKTDDGEGERVHVPGDEDKPGTVLETPEE